MAASLAQLQSQIKDLSRKVVVLTEESVALRQILKTAGIFHDSAFQVLLHQKRFHDVKQSSGWSSCICLEDALSAPEVVMHVASMISQHDLRPIALSATAYRKNMPASTPQLYSVCSTVWETFIGRFDALAGAWEALPSIFSDREGYSAVILGGEFYITGGSTGLRDDATSSVEKFDQVSGLWASLPHMWAARRDHSSSALLGKLYVIGGYCRPGQDGLCSVERYSPEAGAWEMLPPLARGRYAASSAVISGQLYITGGVGSLREACRGNHMKHAERFDVDSGAWEILPTMFHGHSGHASCGISGSLYVIAGNQTPHVECFDPAARLWECLHQLPGRKYSSSIVHGKLYIISGSAVDLEPYERMNLERFDPVTRVWEALPPTLLGHAAVSSCSVAGKLYVVGVGQAVDLNDEGDYSEDPRVSPEREDPVVSLEQFDPVVGEWEALQAVPIDLYEDWGRGGDFCSASICLWSM